VAAVGTTVGLVFGKQVFGGFGKNVFNPAMVGRCFLYVCFPIEMTSRWMIPATEPWGRLLSWSDADAVTSATPLITFKQTGTSPDLWSLIAGSVSGSIGETSAIAVVIGGAYIVYRKAADWRYPLSTILGAMALNVPLYLFGVPGVMEPVHSLFAGSLLFGAFFMATEPVSGCAKKEAKWAYGFLIGALWIFIRSFSGFPEATAFAILLGNTFGPLLDEAVMAWEKMKQKKALTEA
jgi:Na+-transporting NADH:ubiquinone oxidoreductase subunit B